MLSLLFHPCWKIQIKFIVRTLDAKLTYFYEYLSLTHIPLHTHLGVNILLVSYNLTVDISHLEWKELVSSLIKYFFWNTSSLYNEVNWSKTYFKYKLRQTPQSHDPPQLVIFTCSKPTKLNKSGSLLRMLLVRNNYVCM